jgi:hypothetical protein
MARVLVDVRVQPLGKGCSMKRYFRLFGVLAALAGAPVGALADDMGALVRDAIGLPVRPANAAAAPWTLHTRAQTVCTVNFSAERGQNGVYAAAIPSECGAVLPPGVVGWKPVSDGLALVGAGGAAYLDFNRWTARDLVARRGGAPYLELTRPKA